MGTPARKTRKPPSPPPARAPRQPKAAAKPPGARSRLQDPAKPSAASSAARSGAPGSSRARADRTPSPKPPAGITPAAPIARRPTSPQIEELRAYYHSVNDGDRSEVIALLGSMTDPNAARELISLYSECEWRSTKLDILRALGRNPGKRGLEFLFARAQESQDLPIAEAAIWALGQTHQRLAARFLVHYYPVCGEFLRPAVVGALGQVPDRTLAGKFVEELPRAIQANHQALVRNLALTLGELKVREALPHLTKLASDCKNPAIALSALVAIGKISRDPRALDGLEPHFRSDLFEYQLYTNAKTQIQFRSQWKLEDYLTRLFDSSAFHRSLPFELSHFAPDDVREGLKLFAGQHNGERMCQALALIDCPGIAGWYEELIDFGQLDAEGARQVLASLSSHQDAGIRKPLDRLGRHPYCATGEGLLAWIETATLSLPDAEQALKELFDGPRFAALDAQARICALNSWIDLGLGVQTQGARLQAIARVLEERLQDPAAEVQARALRGLADLGCVSRKAQALAHDALTQGADPLAASALFYLERVPAKSALELPSSAITGRELAVLRCLAAQPTYTETPAVGALLGRALAPDADAELALEALRYLARHPDPSRLDAVLRHARGGDPRLSLAAVIALKGIASQDGVADEVAEALSPLLRSPQASIAGRALDTLTALPGMRSKRLLIDFLRERETDPGVCDKIVRCLGTPGAGAEYFVSVIDGILKRHPQHPQRDGLITLRERMAEGVAANRSLEHAIKGADIAAIDRELAAKISGYDSLDEAVRSALRSAELPYARPEMFDEYVDKSASLVEYCKAVDLHLERVLGKRHLFARLENQLHEFQNALHAASLNEDFPGADRVIRQMGLEKHFNAQSLPLHKMVTLAQAIRNGKIVNDRFRTLDGLRAWAVILLVFGRRYQGIKPQIPLRDASDEQIANLCKRLIGLQEVRNPAAHRQTVSKLALLDETRAEALALLNTIQRMF